MLTLQSFLQGIYQFVKSLVVNVTKRMYRNAAVLVTGLAVVTVITFNSTGFGGSGRNALAASKNPVSEEEQNQILDESEETFIATEAKIQVGLTDLRRQGQLVVGDLLTKEIQEKQENELVVQAEIEKIKKEMVMESQAKEKAKKIEEEKAAKRAAAVVSYSDEDYQVLLRIVQAEAGICDEKGKILVANVILNRVRDKEFPNNITDVVYQRSQFSPVSNGSINSVKVSAQTINCVDRALAGEDYSEGALYFMYRNGSRSKAVNWFDGHLTYLFQHERHEFFK